jgi:putative ABC transport system permease protein
VLSQFTQFGTRLLSINPGRARTLGVPGVLGGTTHKLTIEDAEALARVAGVERVVPIVVGSARVEAGERGRSVFVYGVTPNVPEAWKFQVRSGAFWPAGDPRRAGAVAVLGPVLARELFGERNPLGAAVRIAGTRCRVAGVMAPRGRMLGFDIDDTAYVPVASAMRLFNLEELAEVHVLYAHPGLARQVEQEVRAVLTARHRGEEDFTITTQEAMLDVFGNVLRAVTLALAGISLLVGATGILTVMWIAVGERTGEIGLVRALGATRAQVRGMFLAEAVALSTAGGVAGATGSLALCHLLRAAWPGLPVQTPLGFLAAALGVSVATGLASGVAPAARAAALDPVEALRAE